MLETMLKASGIPAKQGRFTNPPPKTYAVYFDDQDTTDGPDPLPGVAPMLVNHDCMVELYEPTPDPAAEAAFEAELIKKGISWQKQDRYWLQNVQRYQVIYEFNFNEKRRA